jgi:hypothetical protein
VPDDERWHVSADYHHFRLGARFRYNGASFYDLFGPTRSSRKGYSLGLDYDRTLVRDTPRTLDLKLSVTGHAGLERLPDAQNVETSEGFSKLLSGQLGLAYKNLRASIGAVDYEKGYKWEMDAATQGVRFVRGGEARWRGFPLFQGSFDIGRPVLLRNASLWLRTAAGYSPGESKEPFANFYFGGFGNNWVDRGEIKRYREVSSFPGVELDEIAGTNYGKVLLDLNLPPLRFRRVGTPAFHAMWARASVFAGGLLTELEGGEGQSRAGDVGAQVDLRLRALSHQVLTLSVGHARAFQRHRSPSREWMVSLKVL